MPRRRIRSTILCSALTGVVSCGSDAPTDSNFTPYINDFLGTWTAVSFGGAPLPQSTTPAPTPPARLLTSLKISITQSSAMWTETAQVVSAGPTFTTTSCNTIGTVGASPSSFLFVALLMGNSCDVNAPETYSLTGDTLRTTHRGQSVLLVHASR